MQRLLVLLGLFAVLAGPAASATQTPPKATVYAASSLTDVFPKIDSNATYSFAGSNTLATQIRNGAPADVFASANMSLPNGLYHDGYCSKPVVFTRNTLVVIVPTANPANIHNVYDLTNNGVKVVVAAPGVPVGAYTQQILKNMNIADAVNKNVVSREIDVRAVLTKVALGEADAGFVYATDAKSDPNQVTAIKVPAWAQPKVQYGICAVSASANKSAAQSFINLVLSKPGQTWLHRYGFLPRVKPKSPR